MNRTSFNKLFALILGSVFILGLLSVTNTTSAEDECKILSATFNPSSWQAPLDWHPDGDVRPSVQIKITTENCKQKKILFSLVEKDVGFIVADDMLGDGGTILTENDDVNDGPKFDDYRIIVPENEEVIITAAAGEDECESTGPSNQTFPDCNYFIEAGPDHILNHKNYSSDGKTSGNLTYNCEETEWLGDCTTPWKYIADTGVHLNDNGNPVSLNDLVAPVDSESPCYDESTGNYDDTCYELLSELPLFDEAGERIDAIRETKSLTGVLNQVYILAIGIAGVLAVIMMIYHAWGYLTTESVTTKVLLKDKLLKIVLGILLLFGSVILLRTINPDLLQLDPGIRNISLATGDDGEGTDATNGAPPAPTGDPTGFAAWAREHGQKITLTKDNGGTIEVTPCDPSDMVTIQVFGGKNLQVQSDIAPIIERISDAWEAQGAAKYVVKSIGGYVCRPITGTTNKISNHSYGLAIDINPQENPYISNPGNMPEEEYTDMPVSFRQLWTNEGFGWGGNWTSKKDAMHFSKIINEQGDQRID